METKQQETTDIIDTRNAPKKNKIHVPIGDRGLAPQDFDGLYRISLIAFESRLAPSSFQSADQVFIALAAGLELGMPTMQSLNSFAVINGKASMYGDAMLGMAYASGQLTHFDEYFEDKDGNRIEESDLPDLLEDWDNGIAAVTEVQRGKLPMRVSRFSVGDAKRATLWAKKTKSGGPTPWITHPKRMMKYKARAFGLRDTFSDVLCGMHMYEELQGEERSTFHPGSMRGADAPNEENGIASRIRNIPNEAKDSAPERPGDDAGAHAGDPEPEEGERFSDEDAEEIARQMDAKEVVSK